MCDRINLYWPQLHQLHSRQKQSPFRAEQPLARPRNNWLANKVPLMSFIFRGKKPLKIYSTKQFCSSPNEIKSKCLQETSRAELTDASVVQTTLIHISKTELRVDLCFQTWFVLLSYRRYPKHCIRGCFLINNRKSILIVPYKLFSFLLFSVLGNVCSQFWLLADIFLNEFRFIAF